MIMVCLRLAPAPMLCARWAFLPAWGARLAATAARQHGAALRAVHVLAAQQQSEAAPAEPPPPPPERRQQPEAQSLSIVAATPTATQLLATFFACELHPSDCYLLHGSVGAGKSYFRCRQSALASAACSTLALYSLAPKRAPVRFKQVDTMLAQSCTYLLEPQGA